MRTMVLAVLIVIARAATLAGQAAYTRDVPAALAAKAKVAEDSAVALALARVPGGQVEKLVLEHEGGNFVYSLDIKVPGKPGIEEVHVEALTGRILLVEHEP